MAGKYYEDLEVGLVVDHPNGRTITETDNVLFSAMTMNTQPLHLNEDYASRTEFGTRIVNGLFTLGLAVGLTVADLTEGTLVANLGYDNVRHPRPVFHGDTLYVRTEVIERRASARRPDNGIVRLRHIGRNQKGETVLTFERACLMKMRMAAAS